MGKLAHFAFTKVENYIDGRYSRIAMHPHMKEFNGYRSEYWDTNTEKPVLLLIHGFGAEAKYQWFEQIELLETKYRLLMPNLLYFGNTKTEERYKVQDQVMYVKDLLDFLDIQSCTILAASYGGLVGMEFTRQFPDRVNRITILGAPVKFIYDSDQKRVKDLFQINRIHDLFIPEDPKGLGVLMSASHGKRIYIPNYFFRPFHDKFYGTTSEHKNKLMDELISIRNQYAEHEYDFDIPIHLIWGSNDPIVPVDRAQKLKEYLGDRATLNVIPKGGHMANMVKPKMFNGLIKRTHFR